MSTTKTQSDAIPVRFKPLEIGPHSVWPPVVLAPMAGITNAPFRQLCRSFGAGLYVSEMVTSRLLVEGNKRTEQIASFAEDESPRSIQLYGVDPAILGKAIAKLREENKVDHIDLNFGCPVRKVTRKGGGAAIPLKTGLFRNLIRAAVKNAGALPVTVKFRTGLNQQYETYVSAGKIAEEEGCAAVALHARSAEQYYDGDADWGAIKRLKETVQSIPVLGNGGIWLAEHAVKMMQETGCDGVVVGRGCLGRPWLFRDLDRVFNKLSIPAAPVLGEVAAIMKKHIRMQIDWVGENVALRNFRKHTSWYLKGFEINTELYKQLMSAEKLDELESLLDMLPADQSYPLGAATSPRGKSGRQKSVALPNGYLHNLHDDSPPDSEAEDPASGG